MSEATHEVHLHDPQTLYRHWEENQWSPWDIDLSTDRAQWQTMDDRSLVSFVLGSLMVAEERITTKFSGLVGADGSQEEVTFLATQQVDEARHMQFYARFQDEVVSEPAVIAAHVERAREQVSPAFQTIFDDKLVAAHDRLLANPGDRAAKVAFVTIYHLILEATLGLTTFEFSTRFMARDAAQSWLCALSAAAVLVSILANAVVGWSWLDPIIGLGIAGLAVHEGREAWAGKVCADRAPIGLKPHTDCGEDCCATIRSA